MATASKKKNNLNPNLSANFFSKLLFWWSKDFFWNGRDFDFQTNTLYDVLPENESERLSDELEIFWHSELTSAESIKRKPSLWRAIIKAHKFTLLKNIAFVVLSYVIMILQPDVLKLLVSYFDQPTRTTKFEAYFYATLMMILLLLQVGFFRHGFLGLAEIGLRVKVACSSLIYKKTIRLHCSVVTKNTTGTIINLLTNDLTQLEMMFLFLPYFFIIPPQIIIVIYLMWKYIAFMSLVVVFIMVLQLIPIQVLCYKISLKLRSQLTIARDERISLISEVINGISVLKMYVWEKPFERLIYLAREREITIYMKIAYLSAILVAVGLTSHRVAIYFLILITKLSDKTIKVADVITVTQYLLMLRSTVAYYFFNAVRLAPAVKISIIRMEDFLLLDEAHVGKQMVACKNDDGSVSINEVTATYGKTSAEVILRDVSLKLPANKLCIISGSIGSGKTSLFKLILKELEIISGDVHVNGRVSYASQEPWLFNGSIKANIIFGSDYDEEKYYRVTKACALIEDFHQLPYGDKTLVGERGTALSGGQQARINLARAAYKDGDIHLLDDPFAAVNAKVAETIFEDCVNGFLRNKTRVLVSHNADFFSQADLIILMKNGEVRFNGTFEDFCSNDRHLHLLFNTGQLKTQETKISEIQTKSNLSKIKDYNDEEPNKNDEFLVQDNIPNSVYWEYIRAGHSKVKLIFLILLLILSALSLCGFDYLSIKLAHQDIRNNKEEVDFYSNSTLSSTTFSSDNSLFCIFSGLVITILVAPILYYFSLFKMLLTTNKNIHNKMFGCLIRTSLRFFEINPAGRILNRFSEDTGIVDDTLPYVIYDALEVVFIVPTVVFPCLIVNFWNIISLAVFMLICFILSKGFLRTTQRLRRLARIATSPILSYTTSTISGIIMIRSSKVEHFVRKTFNSLLNNYTMVNYLIILLGQVFSYWLESLTALFFGFVACVSIAMKSDNINGGYVALSLLRIFEMTVLLSFSVRQITESLSLMINIERMVEFTKLQPEEKLGYETNNNVCTDWPIFGKIEFKQLYLRYSEGDVEPVLKNINLLIEPRMKIGIVGRTGAGKSSLISALFRLAYFDGTLLIDGVDIKNISLPHLRSKISIIPQEPIIFSTTLRANIDPFNKLDDATIWSVLERVNLDKTFHSLDQIIDRGGLHLSSGQRQLLCFARAIVKKNKIIVMDEATANIDPTTDTMIQKFVKMNFKDYTVLIIAHRLNSIMDFDKILVIDNGKVVKYDLPQVVLKKKIKETVPKR